MSRRLLLAVATLFAVTACGGEAQPTPPASTGTSTAVPTTTTTTTSATDATFSASVNDALTALNMQLPILHEGANPLPTSVGPGGVFGGRTAPAVEIYLLPENSAFSKVRAVTVHVTGSNGAFQTPARLLSGVGTSLYGLSADAAGAFTTDALPKLSAITQVHTKMTVGSFYDLTVVARDSSSLAFVFTPVGVASSAFESLGK